MEGIDRRERTRRRLREPATAEWQGHRLTGEATELSRDSVFVEAVSAPHEDAAIELTIGSGDAALHLPCRVRRAAGGGFAGEFEILTAAQREALDKFLNGLPY